MGRIIRYVGKFISVIAFRHHKYIKPGTSPQLQYVFDEYIYYN